MDFLLTEQTGDASEDVLPLPAGVVDRLSLQHLLKLQEQFRELDTDNVGSIDHPNFIRAMSRVLEDTTSDEVTDFFYKMDANAIGRVSWKTFVTHVLQIYNQRDVAIAHLAMKPFQEDVTIISCLVHTDVMVCIKLYPILEGQRDGTGGCYVGISRCGYLMTWSPDMKLLSKLHVEQDDRNQKQTVTVTDMTCLPDAQMIAVSTTVWDIRFYDSNPAEFERHFSIVEFPFCIMCLDYHTSPRSSEKSILVCGDTGGNVNLIWIGYIFFHNLRRSVIIKQKLNRIPFANIVCNHVVGLEVLPFPKLHSNWVVKVKYISAINSFISCAACTNEAMSLYDVIKMCHYLFRSNKGIICFDFCATQNYIVTGGMDYNVKLWNPFVNSRPNSTLQGHMTPVMHILLDDVMQMIISISKDKYIKIWHLHLHICMHTLNCSVVGLGSHDIEAAIYNPLKHVMVIATYKLALLRSVVVDDFAKYMTHTKPVCAALYNRTFNYVITGGQDSTVLVWDLNTGRKIYEFTKAHSVVKSGIEYPIQITAMRLDPTERRLITGGQDGKIKIWNFNNGICLNEFQTVDRQVVTGIAFAGHHHLFAVGWNRRVTQFYDDGVDSFHKIWAIQHEDDILGVDTHQGQILATASYDGEIIIWIRENGFVKFRLRDTRSIYAGFVSKADQEGKVEEEDGGDDEKEGEEEVEKEELSERRKSSSGPEDLIKGNSRSSKKSVTFKLPEKSESDDESEGEATSTIDKLLFLQNRPIAIDVGSLLSCGKDGYIRVWSVCPGSGLLGRFHGPYRSIDAVLCMASDARNRYLITGPDLAEGMLCLPTRPLLENAGDTSGYVRVWELEGYCHGQEEVPKERQKQHYNRFPYFRLMKNIELRAGRDVSVSDSFPETVEKEEIDPRLVQVKPPLLLSCFRAHLQAILHVEYVDELDLVLTSGRDGSVRLWYVYGCYVGTFGQKDLWDLDDMPYYSKGMLRPMPGDIRRLASPTTLKVINKGACPRWDMALEILRHCKSTGMMNFSWLKDDEEDERKEELGGKAEKEEGPILGKYHVVKRMYHPRPELDHLYEINFKLHVYPEIPIPQREELKQIKLAPFVEETLRKSRLIGGRQKRLVQRSVTFGGVSVIKE